MITACFRGRDVRMHTTRFAKFTTLEFGSHIKRRAPAGRQDSVAYIPVNAGMGPIRRTPDIPALDRIVMK